MSPRRPGRSKSCRRATQQRRARPPTTSEPWLKPCSTCRAVESAASAVATCQARRRRRASPRAATSEPTADEDAGRVRERADSVGRQRVQEAGVVAGQHRVHEVQHGAGADDRGDDERRAPADAARRGASTAAARRRAPPACRPTAGAPPGRARRAGRSGGRRRSRPRSAGTPRARRRARADSAAVSPLDASPACVQRRAGAPAALQTATNQSSGADACRASSSSGSASPSARPGQRQANEVEPAGRGERDREQQRDGRALYAARSLREAASKARAALPRQSAQLWPPRTRKKRCGIAVARRAPPRTPRSAGGTGRRCRCRTRRRCARDAAPAPPAAACRAGCWPRAARRRWPKIEPMSSARA